MVKLGQIRQVKLDKFEIKRGIMIDQKNVCYVNIISYSSYGNCASRNLYFTFSDVSVRSLPEISLNV